MVSVELGMMAKRESLNVRETLFPVMYEWILRQSFKLRIPTDYFYLFRYLDDESTKLCFYNRSGATQEKWMFFFSLELLFGIGHLVAEL